MGLAFNEGIGWRKLGFDTGAIRLFFFFGLCDGRKSGPHVDNFLISGPLSAVERQLDTVALTMDLRDVVRLHDKGSCGLLVGMDNCQN